jgi:hypothetical protein
MGKPLVRFCEGPGNNKWHWVKGTRHVVVACDEASKRSLTSASDSNDHLGDPGLLEGNGVIGDENKE